MTYKIEKGIALPPHLRARQACPYPFEDMSVGDSFAVTVPAGKDPQSVRGGLDRFAKRFGIKIATRTSADGKTVRCWRIPKIERETKPARAVNVLDQTPPPKRKAA